MDFPVLRFVSELDYRCQWQFDREGPIDELPSLTGEGLDGALRGDVLDTLAEAATKIRGKGAEALQSLAAGAISALARSHLG